ncbi:MAG: hypothetical protein ACP5HG_05600, partial [Anaerolineae bacterium]
MCRKLWLLWPLIALMAIAAARTAPVAAQAPDDERLVLAFYCADLDWSTWALPLCDQPMSPYVSTDDLAIARHVRQARDAGIDALIQTWCGPALADNPTEMNLHALLNHSAAAGQAAAALVDLTGDLLTTSQEIEDALIALRDGHAQHAAYLHVAGRPVVFFLGQARLSTPSWEALRNRVDPDRRMLWLAEGASTEPLTVFDGLYLYTSVTPGSVTALTSRWSGEVRAWSVAHGEARLWVATVMPGYDNRATAAEDDVAVVPRNDGATYEASWAAAEASDPDWIVIRSFNGWRDCTHIEPSVAYGETYLDRTSELIAAYRTPPQDTATPTVTPTALVTPTLTATLPPPTATLTVTLSPSPTMTLTPTATLIPTATPFRLATPTSPASPGPGTPSGAPQRVTPASVGDVGVGTAPAPTPTPIPRLLVEGDRPRRC